MGRIFVTYEFDGKSYKAFVDMKTYDPDGYKEEQERLKSAYKSGKNYFFKKVHFKVCPTCGDKYYTIEGRQIYDTDRCKWKAQRDRKRQNVVNTCVVCKATFEPQRADAKFCSNKCRQKDYRYRKKLRQRWGG